jgi:hypothetical protein
MSLLSAEKIIKELGSLERSKQLGDYWALVYMQAEDELNKSDAELAKSCEPVAYIHKDGKTLVLPDDMWNPLEIGSNWTPLYTSPPEREPLSDEVISLGLTETVIHRPNNYKVSFRAGVRWAEKKHGITVENEKQESL